MKIGLIDVDGSRFPNLPLMKISAYHKSLGDEVGFYEPLGGFVDRIYMSKIFIFSEDFAYPLYANEIIRGGTGYDRSTWKDLPCEIEHIYPDYDLYGVESAYGFLTRGCPRHCPFCIVSEKEGARSRKVADLDEFFKGQKEIKLLDPNILAAKEHEELLLQLIESKAWVDFTQGIDARLLTEKNIELLRQIKLKRIHFAWDDIKDEKAIVPKLTWFREVTGITHRKATVYILTNYNSTFEEDLYRVYKIRDIGMTPYVMIYEKEKLEKGHVLKKLQRYVNCQFIFRKIQTFEEYTA